VDLRALFEVPRSPHPLIHEPPASDSSIQILGNWGVWPGETVGAIADLTGLGSCRGNHRKSGSPLALLFD